MAYRQCPKRLWLQIHRPELGEREAGLGFRLTAGVLVGEVARRVFDLAGQGVLVEAGTLEERVAQTGAAMAARRPVFEAALVTEGAQVWVDLLLPEGDTGWRLVEVKSAASIKQHYRDDLAIQAHVVERAGIVCESTCLATIDSDWVYPGQGDYRGLFKLTDLTAEVAERRHEVTGWINDAHAVIARDSEPMITTGPHCRSPHPCEFYGHCSAQEAQPEFPLAWLPGSFKRRVRDFIAAENVRDMRELPDHLLTPLQQRVKAATLNNSVYFDREATRAILVQHGLPAGFLDFETAQLVIPRWPGQRPYAQVPFQFSLHWMTGDGQLEHTDFLDLSGDDPSRAFAEALVSNCGDTGPIYVYHRAFEAGRVRALAERFGHLRQPLLALARRMVDLLPIAREHYYHPAQQGSWSIKKLLPAVAPTLDYSQLQGVQDGGMAMEAYAEATSPGVTAERREQLRGQLRAYCALDTLAMVRIWEVFGGWEALPESARVSR